MHMECTAVRNRQKGSIRIFSRINYKIEWLAVSSLRQEDDQPFLRLYFCFSEYSQYTETFCDFCIWIVNFESAVQESCICLQPITCECYNENWQV